MKNRKIALILISVSMSILVLAGCGSTKAPTTTKTPTTTKSQTTTKAPIAMESLYSNSLKSLVASKAITQTQSNKVLVELTKDKSNVNKLSTLVKSRIITQAQADKINQNIKNNILKIK